MGRTYDMTKRARSAARTTEAIAEATETLLTDSSLSEITLKEIAEKAGVTVQTVLRHMSSLEGCLLAVAERVFERVKKQRESMEPGNVSVAINNLITHYEKEGKLILNLLAREQSGDALATDLTNRGRAYHREWVRKLLVPATAENRTNQIDALVAATDIYIWKLLRFDIGRTRKATETVMMLMVQKLTEAI